jgi:molybdenum cofactor cytidylyltransferase
MNLRPAIIVLAAAGPPRRTAGAAASAPIAPPSPGRDPRVVLGATIGHAIQTHWRVITVTTPGLAPLVSEWVATRDLVVLSAEDQARGTGFAISAGVAAQADADGWLLLPGDLSLVAPSTLLAVGAALEDHPAAYAQYRGRRCHPLGFAAELYSDLITLQGEDGARRLLGRYPAAGVEVDDPGVLGDNDAPDERAAVRAAGAL